MAIRSSLFLGTLALISVGCSHYQVQDPTTGKTYYTQYIWSRPGGAISFEDERTGSDITLQNSEVKKIDGDLYESRTDKDARPAGAKIEVDVDDDDDLDLDLDASDDDVEVDIDD